ncbi:growth arrest-specific protein 2-like isoform X2 [Ischnura elegans]|uniref:growth arrest-specific protein 2-like isoform X2 n=1 Tax=Ischnura elegans TaxID=197161 RepID=UPI001ED89A45|nr:growth arrest-specific protein 2-like isoform X2 [Ischnura elegans]
MTSWRSGRPRPASATWSAVAGPGQEVGVSSPGQRLFLQQQEYSTGLVLPPGAPETEEEYVEYYQERILSSQEMQLYPLKEDLAEWLNKTLEIDYITAENFLDALDNGMVVCRLAQVIQEKAQLAVEAGRFPGPAPTIRPRFWEHAARRSFFCRDNMENFIKFCRKLGVHENLLFESDDLVLHSQPRNVVLCLLEVSRLAARFDLEPPGLVQLEREIAQQEEREANTNNNWRHSIAVVPPAPRPANKMRHSSSSSALSAASSSGGGGRTRWGGSASSSPGPRAPGRPRSADRRSLATTPGASSEGGATSGHRQSSSGRLRRAKSEGGGRGGGGGSAIAAGAEEDWSSSVGGSEASSVAGVAVGARGLDLCAPKQEITELDRRILLQVQQVARMSERRCQCPAGKCSRLKVKKLGEGKYSIAGRNVFIRLLKGRHMMVRVGGGWDTLEHFLVRHDPCAVRVVSRKGEDSGTADDACSSSYLHIRAKYRSPPLDGVGC